MTEGVTIAAGAARSAPSDAERFAYVLRLADNALILGQRLTEWSARAPTLELDIALSNQSLDLFGQARMLLDYAGRIEGEGRSEDDLAFMRDVYDFRNLLMVEQPVGDFGYTIVRQALFSVFARLQYTALAQSSDAELAAIAAKSVKELTYHARHACEWVVRLGDGTKESHARAQAALDALWPYTGELFESDEIDRAVASAAVGPLPEELRAAWVQEIGTVLDRATLDRPEDAWMQSGGRHGRHSEHLGHILAEMQFLQRAYPGAKW